MDTKGMEDKCRFGVGDFERRKFPRFSMELPIEYLRTRSSIPASGRTGDISEGGLLVYLSERVEVGEYLRVKLFFTLISESMNNMQILAEVAWVVLENLEAHGLVECYRCGLRFIDVKPKDLERLKVFLKSLAQI